jgi:hypothetical protein
VIRHGVAGAEKGKEMKGSFARRIIALLVAIAAAAVPAAAAPKVKYEKTEVEKARGKCVGAILLGGLAGALVGRATGKGNTAGGAALGVAAGAGACAIIMANARNKDRIIAAQLAAARAGDGRYSTTFASDDGQTVTMNAVAGGERRLSADQLRPVKYAVDGNAMASPMLVGDGQLCRPVGGSLQGGSGAAALPSQMVCRTPEGDYAPYAVVMAAKDRANSAG